MARKLKSLEMIKIDKKIKMPKKASGRPRRYPFDKMLVGDSFVTDLQSTASAAHSYGKGHNMKFASRKEGKKFRIWLIK
jgi:hypothetical protein